MIINSMLCMYMSGACSTHSDMKLYCTLMNPDWLATSTVYTNHKNGCVYRCVQTLHTNDVLLLLKQGTQCVQTLGVFN